jgi:DNA primase
MSRLEKAAIEAIKDRHRLSETVSAVTSLKRHGAQYSGCCPFHNERTPSFYVSDQRGTYHCYGCGAHGDIIDFKMLQYGLTFAEAIDSLGREIDPARRVVRSLAKTADVDEERRIKHAHEIWLRREPARCTLAGSYLHDVRGISNRIPDVLGYTDSAYCSTLSTATPALLAPLQDRNGHVTAIQQIFIDPRSRDAHRDERGRRVKRTIGVMRDGAVRLALPGMSLGLAGSVEDALSAMELFSLPVWATCGEARLSSVWVPEDAERVVIFADSDDAGQREAERAAKIHGRRHAVDVMLPEGVKDWNEQLQEQRKCRSRLNGGHAHAV